MARRAHDSPLLPRLTIVSMGVGTFEHLHDVTPPYMARRFQHQYPTRRPHAKNSHIIQRTVTPQYTWMDDTFIHVVDVRFLPTAQSISCHTHIGMHDEYLQLILGAEAFTTFVERVAAVIDTVLFHEGRHTLILASDEGTHRSVAAAEILYFAMHQLPRISAERMHLCDRAWLQRCLRWKVPCTRCSLLTQACRRQLDTASRMITAHLLEVGILPDQVPQPLRIAEHEDTRRVPHHNQTQQTVSSDSESEEHWRRRMARRPPTAGRASSARSRTPPPPRPTASAASTRNTRSVASSHATASTARSVRLESVAGDAVSLHSAPRHPAPPRVSTSWNSATSG
eukprot:4608038-Amphidinium_carterae.2